MKTVVPNYYSDFKCIAEKCRHNCCIGWEIDIDSETLEYYNSVPGELGKRLKHTIEANDGTPHFILADNERCPFLNSNNLCDIITELGEERLCQICSDHPRYRNFFSDRVEMGIGLCCEAAAWLILSQTEKMKLFVTEDGRGENEAENKFFLLRDSFFSIIQNREKTVKERAEELMSVCGIKRTGRTLSEWADIYLSLERLDTRWTELLERLKAVGECKIYYIKELETAYEQLMIYFIYRHCGDGLYDGRIRERVAFSLLSFYIIQCVCTVNGITSIDGFTEIARMYSSEIEYCEENTEALFRILE